jgi:hypothetical protein
MAQAPPLTATTPHENPAPIRERAQSDTPQPPHRKRKSAMGKQPEPVKENEKQLGNSAGMVNMQRIISYNLTEEQRPDGLRVRFKVRIETGKKAVALDTRQAEAIRELLQWSREHRTRQNEQ